MILARCLLLLLSLAACAPTAPGPPQVHYVVGKPYQQAGVWYYPREDYSLDDTGLAFVIDGNHSARTADGEAFDQTALAAAHPTLQLPAIARITNLENGRQVMVRVNDRTPARPDRLVAITRRTAELLAAGDPTAIRVRMQVLESESRQVVSGLAADGPKLAIAAAPPGSVQAESLAPPSGARQGAGAPVPVTRLASAVPDPPDPPIPLRLPEVVTAVPVRPTTLYVDCGDFSRLEFAEELHARVRGLGAAIVTSYDAPRETAFMVRIGPLANVAAAEVIRRRAVAAGAVDARIVVD